MPEEDIGDGIDAGEALRIAVIVIGLLLNVWVMWDYMKDRPETMIMRQRAKSWWERKITSPSRKAKDLRKAEGETIFEAMRIVEGS